MLLVDFIETPSQNFTQEDLQAGIKEVISSLNKNSSQIVSIGVWSPDGRKRTLSNKLFAYCLN